ncbi:hypothetical protein DRW41_10350 [Neobacillus piezotolerans]|uniref:Uncharacterized protein n=1 Tax=Neobacillus piezotolerans TaxID=2259171 RepID=A0A3D8GRX6_9BACI|nr:hypothetical protein [Neobacillus piezotolerans]RDU37077.1 hypothetical protein DRW41_10350 [Neobacillus piezotolerans]
MADQFQLSNSFDHDFGQQNELTTNNHHDHGGHHDHLGHHNDHLGHHSHINGNNFSDHGFLDYQDPLKHAYKHQFQPLNLDLGNIHFVKPHHVDGYFRSDGTYVEGYYRDGDGNTAINRPLEAGGGYLRSDPDGNPFNNL